MLSSCLYSRTAAPSLSARAGIKIQSGNAIVRIDGRVNENLHSWSMFQESHVIQFDDTPLVREGSITKNETRIMSSGDEYFFSVMPTEVVTINVRSMDGRDVELIVLRHGREEPYTIPGTNVLGMTIGFSNR